MNEKIKTFIYSLIIILCLGYSIFSTVNWARNGIQLSETRTELAESRAELGQLRTELERARNQQLIIAERLNRCTELSERTGELLSSSISTVEGLRTTLRDIRKNEENLANELLYLRGYINTDDNNTNNTTN